MIHESLCDSRPEALAQPVRTHYTPLEHCAAVTHTSTPPFLCHATTLVSPKYLKGFFFFSLCLSLLSDILHRARVQDSTLRTKARHRLSLAQTQSPPNNILSQEFISISKHLNLQETNSSLISDSELKFKSFI